jgi:hypothetical protein
MAEVAVVYAAAELRDFLKQQGDVLLMTTIGN